MKRKDAIKLMTAGAAFTATGATAASSISGERTNRTLELKGNINHSVCRWCYSKVPMEEFLDAAKEIGIKGIDLLGPDEWQLAIDKGLTCSISTGDKFGIVKGFNDPKLHDALYDNYANLIPKAADLGIKNIICFSGNRNGLSDEQGMINCAKGLEPVGKISAKAWCIHCDGAFEQQSESSRLPV